MAVVTSAANLTDSLSFRKHSDPSKRCLHCNSVFYRRHAEPKKDYNKRDTCSRDCAKFMEGFGEDSREDYDHRLTDPKMRTCGNCEYMREDSEIGEHCGPCNSGNKFKSKEDK